MPGLRYAAFLTHTDHHVGRLIDAIEELGALAFTSYDEARSGAEAEALAVAQQYETAQLMPADVSEELGNELVCYARSVVFSEWPRLVSGTQAEGVNPWAAQTSRDQAPCRSIFNPSPD
jgi:hypothetical protein